jgi:serine protease
MIQTATSRCHALLAALLACTCVLLGLIAAAPASAADYVPGEVIVGYTSTAATSMVPNVASRIGIRSVAASPAPGVQVLRLLRGVSVSRAVAALKHQPGVAYAVPNYVAHAAGNWVPNDPGRAHSAAAWQNVQWNFLAAAGVDAPGAWANLFADRRPGGRGVVIAVLDTGVAYRSWHQFRRSPDFGGTRFIDPYDFVAGNRFPLDREGHGTFVTGTLAETTNNGIGLTGLAYGAAIMPVRVLDANGDGDAATIARGIRYAVNHGAAVINLSLEFDITVNAADIPDIISAINYAHRRGVIVVAASGNDSSETIAYPARAPGVISVGATTRDRCLAEYSNGGSGLDLVAPGGGDDAALTDDPNCHPERNLPDIFQMTMPDPLDPHRFGFPGGWFGTSMAAPHVAAAAALVIASGVLGRHPSPDQVLTRLEQTAQPLGGTVPNENYGYGLLDAAAATAPTAAQARARAHKRLHSTRRGSRKTRKRG